MRVRSAGLSEGQSGEAGGQSDGQAGGRAGEQSEGQAGGQSEGQAGNVVNNVDWRGTCCF